MRRSPLGRRTARGLRLRLSLWTLAAASSVALASAAAAEDVLFVSPAFDQNDRIGSILGALTPKPTVQRLALERRPPPRLWGLGPFDTQKARLSGARWVVLEAVHATALDHVETEGGRSLGDALPDWVRRGGHLLVVGGFPSFDSYRSSELLELLPVMPAPDDGANRFKATLRRPLRGDGADGRYVEHVHPVAETRGEVILRAGSEPFAVRWAVGEGQVVAVLGGIVEYFTPDSLERDPKEFFNSTAWERFLLAAARAALERPLELAPLPDPMRHAIPVARTGAQIRSDFWFPGTSGGVLSLSDPRGGVVWSAEPDGSGWLRLPEHLRHGVYRARFEQRDGSRERAVRIGGPADPADFDIRFFSHAHGPYPWGLAPGEAWARAVELADAGITSVVFPFHTSARFQSQRDVRALREIIGAGLGIVYQQSLRPKHFGRSWPFPGRAPLRALDSQGRDVGWDIHDEAFRRGVDALLDEVVEVRALPDVRALQVIEENRDGDMTSPSLLPEMRAAGLTSEEKPGSPGWFRYQEIRSRASGATYQRFRKMAQRFLHGVPLSTYWPGSYWLSPNAYALRVGELARAVDELLGPGYGYQYSPFDVGWFSVVSITAQMFAAQGHTRPPGGGFAVYALGDIYENAPGRVGPRTWRDTAWTALGHGAAFLAYFQLPRGEALRPLADLHAELFRVGPWIAAAPRRPAPVAILNSWTTRAESDPDGRLRHYKCAIEIHRDLAKSFEEVDYLLEEQAADPPAELRAVVAAGTPYLTDETIDALTGFAERGGVLVLEPGTGRNSPTGPRAGDPWRRARATGRVHEMPFNGPCKGAGPSLSARFASQGIESMSSTEAVRTEARLLGGPELWVWVLLNHDEKAREVSATARIDGDGVTWRDLRSGAAPDLRIGRDVRIRRLVGAGDAAVLIGVRRPAASIAVTTEVTDEDTAVSVLVAVEDSAGRPVADGYPVELAAHAGGASVLPPKSRSRTTRGGVARWTVPIPVETAGGPWSFVANDPVTGRTDTSSLVVVGPDVEDAAPGG